MKTQCINLKKELEFICPLPTPVLITGETGTGKSALAYEIHRRSNVQGPWVELNLASSHPGTLESELYGHEPGAFTGANHRRVGKLSLAAKGTLFLDEIAELPLELQPRLLEFLQNHTFTPLGSNKKVTSHCRIITATCQNLQERVEQGLFRKDLFFRIRGLLVELPSLCDSPDLLNQAIHDTLENVTKQHHKRVFTISKEVAEWLETYPWPGNYRELHSVLEITVLQCSGHSLELEHLPRWFLAERERTQSKLDQAINYKNKMRTIEKQIVLQTLRKNSGNRLLAAQQLGFSLSTLKRKLA